MTSDVDRAIGTTTQNMEEEKLGAETLSRMVTRSLLIV